MGCGVVVVGCGIVCNLFSSLKSNGVASSICLKQSAYGSWSRPQPSNPSKVQIGGKLHLQADIPIQRAKTFDRLCAILE